MRNQRLYPHKYKQSTAARLSLHVLAFIGAGFILNATIEAIKTMPPIHWTRTITITNDAPNSETPSVTAYLEYMTDKQSQPSVYLEEKPTEEKTAEVSAYNPTEAQTDASPRIMASNKEVYPGAIANNCLPFGAHVKLAGKVYTVEDRMNPRYTCDHFDIFMESEAEALAFGRQKLPYAVIE